jgi:hypothetical protein
MATYSRPGVFIQEVDLPQAVALADNGNAVGAFVGALAKGPTAAPVLLNSWTDFTKTFGNLEDAYPTTWAAYNFFANGGRQLYVKRTLGSGSARASVLLSDRSQAELNTLLVRAANAGSWGTQIAVEIKAAGTSNRFSLIVYGAPTVSGVANSNVLEQFTDLSMGSTDPRYVVSVINSSSSYITVEDQNSASVAPDDMPAIDGLKALTGGQNGSEPVLANYEDALDTFDSIMSPLVFNIPAVAYLYTTSDDNTARTLTIDINAKLIAYCESRGDAFAIIDTPSGLTVGEAQTYLGDVTEAALILDSDSGCAASYYPWLAIPDSLRATPGALRSQAPGAVMVGQYLATDASRGVFKTPAGYANRIALAVATERQLTNAELDSLNAGTNPINAIRQIPGTGIVVMGGRTLHNSPGDRYINVRRSLIHIKKELTDRSSFAVFENNDERLWSQIRVSLGSFLRSYWQQGGLRGASPDQAFYVKVDASTTSNADIQNGKVNIEIGVAIEYPAEFIVIKLGQITGNATV